VIRVNVDGIVFKHRKLRTVLRPDTLGVPKTVGDLVEVPAAGGEKLFQVILRRREQKERKRGAPPVLRWQIFGLKQLNVRLGDGTGRQLRRFHGKVVTIIKKPAYSGDDLRTSTERFDWGVLPAHTLTAHTLTAHTQTVPFLLVPVNIRGLCYYHD
jgi:hypothetical protein